MKTVKVGGVYRPKYMIAHTDRNSPRLDVLVTGVFPRGSPDAPFTPYMVITLHPDGLVSKAFEQMFLHFNTRIA